MIFFHKSEHEKNFKCKKAKKKHLNFKSLPQIIKNIEF